MKNAAEIRNYLTEGMPCKQKDVELFFSLFFLTHHQVLSHVHILMNKSRM